MSDASLPINIKPKNSAATRLAAAVGVVGAAAAAAAVGYFNPVTAGFFPQCPLHALTGLNCPGCGLTRGFHALFQGDVLTALHFNALLPVYLYILGYFFLSLVLIAARGRGLSIKAFPPKAMYGFLILMLVFGVARNLPFYPFNLLSI